MSENASAGMSLIVKTITRFLAAFICLFGIYVVLYGHLTPGGGFSGGVIIACAFILLTLAEGQVVGLKTVGKVVSSWLASIGALIFLGAALAGLFAGKAFFTNLVHTGGQGHSELLASPMIQICEIGIALIVGMGLYLAFTVLAGTRVVPGAAGSGK